MVNVQLDDAVTFTFWKTKNLYTWDTKIRKPPKAMLMLEKCEQSPPWRVSNPVFGVVCPAAWSPVRETPLS
jgi:hypothetical protein